MHPQRRSQSLAVLLTSLHSGPPLTQSRSIQQIYCSADEDLASTLITDLPLSVRVSGVERKGCLQAEGETLNKWTWPADVGVPPSSFTPACPERWDCVMPRLFPRLGSGRNGEKERGSLPLYSQNRLHSSDLSENNTQLSLSTLISQMKDAGISYGVEIAYRSISKYSC